MLGLILDCQLFKQNVITVNWKF